LGVVPPVGGAPPKYSGERGVLGVAWVILNYSPKYALFKLFFLCPKKKIEKTEKCLTKKLVVI
jgi:hypothetical protein